MIYKKIHSLSLNSIDNFSKGKIINISGSELNVLEYPIKLCGVVFFLPYIMIVTLILLWRLFGWYSIFGLTA